MSIAKNDYDREKLMKKLNQKRTEAELWKQKYENQINQMIKLKNVDSLGQELVKLRRVQEQDDAEITRLLMDNENLRKILESRDYEIQELQLILSEKNDEIERLLNELQEIKSRLVYQFETSLQDSRKENAHLRELTEQQSKEIFQLEQMRREMEVKKLQVMELENENNRLQIERDESVRLYQIENQELKDHLKELESEYNLKLEEVNDYKMECEQQKLRVYEIEIDKNHCMEELRQEKQNLENAKNDKIYQLSNDLEFNSAETKRLKKQVECKSDEIDKLLMEKNLLERENCRLKDEMLKNEFRN